MAVQQTKTSDITDRLSALANQWGRPSEFEVHALKREIDKIKVASPAEHYMLLGMLYAISGRLDPAIENHEVSIRISGDAVEYANYGLSLRRLGRSNDALEMLVKAFELSLTVDAFSDVLVTMVYSGNFSRFEEVVARFVRANPGYDISQLRVAESIMMIREDLKRANVLEEEFNEAMGMVERVVVGSGFFPTSTAVFHGAFDGVSHVSVEMVIGSASPHELVKINDLIADVLVESNLVSWDRMIFNVVRIAEPVDSGLSHVG